MFGRGVIRSAWAAMYRSMLHRRTMPLTDQELRRSAMVFAPHFDDETLACGGTIIRQRRLGAAVSLVFMTDGAASHGDLLPSERLTRLRKAEALEAAAVLGVMPGAVTMLDYPDSRLRDHMAEAAGRVGELLRQSQPETIFVPYQFDRLADHEATWCIVNEALRSIEPMPVVYEYPMWFWHHWPWAGRAHLEPTSWEATLKESLREGRNFLRFCRARVDIAEVLPIKRQALACHASQMTHQYGDPNRPTLGEVWDGGFLDCMMQPHEVFVNRSAPPVAGG